MPGPRYTQSDGENLLMYLAHPARRALDRQCLATYSALGPRSAEAWSRQHKPEGWLHYYRTLHKADYYIRKLVMEWAEWEDGDNEEGRTSEGHSDDEDEKQHSDDVDIELEAHVDAIQTAYPHASRDLIYLAIEKHGDPGRVADMFAELLDSEGHSSADTTPTPQKRRHQQRGGYESDSDYKTEASEESTPRRKKRRAPGTPTPVPSSRSRDTPESDDDDLPLAPAPQVRRAARNLRFNTPSASVDLDSESSTEKGQS
ncbi:hypothetical protein MIND_00411300 [Mycena indigotica]|uniref:Uncharacterized protein n=1 Tax=Mycena indigotica TaxID=2126181 RepID=A0A8H6SUN1_9AGAR|nr:uncharacterized protein MIND_00411300 [Mycena indigotica]KAF7306208.1 hypothetical protein MIND_00411300 [Mycena indigotica]